VGETNAYSRKTTDGEDHWLEDWKKTRRKIYFEYLIKWKGPPIEDASWENEADIQKHGKSVQELMDMSP
jgi:hypothetical protein